MITIGRAKLRFHRKVTLVHSLATEIAIAEIMVWSVPKSRHYPAGLKYRLFLVARESGDVILGFDNHKPKGPHLHRGGKERAYEFRNLPLLVEDFWRMAAEEGFLL